MAPSSERSAASPTIAQNWLDLSAERGLSTFDQRHLLNVQMQYTTGMGLGGKTLLSGWKGTLFKEWTFLTQITVGSGLPETPIYLAAVPGTGVTGSIRPDYTGAPLYAAPSGLFLNPAAYTAPLGRPMGKRGKRFDHRPRSIHLEHFHGAHIPLERPIQSRFADRLHKLSQPRHFYELEYNHHQHAIRIADRGQCHAQHANHAAVEVLRDATRYAFE